MYSNVSILSCFLAELYLLSMKEESRGRGKPPWCAFKRVYTQLQPQMKGVPYTELQVSLILSNRCPSCWAVGVPHAELQVSLTLSYRCSSCWATDVPHAELHMSLMLSYRCSSCWATGVTHAELQVSLMLSYRRPSCWATDVLTRAWWLIDCVYTKNWKLLH